jgi:hypothetical protein
MTTFTRTNPNWIETGPPASPLLLAWAAGFFDGEGCICAFSTKRSDNQREDFRLHVMVVQNHPETLERFRRAVGVACSVHQVKKRPGTNGPIFMICYAGRKAIEVLRRLEPYIYRKAKELRVAECLWTKGRLGLRSGPKGWPPRVWQLRRRLVAELSALKGRRKFEASR